MTWLDWFFLVLIVVAFIQGFLSGFLKSISRLAVIVIVLMIDFALLDPLVDQFEQAGWNSTLSVVVAFIVLLLVVGIGVQFIAKGIEKLIEAVHLGLVNRLLGGVFGIFQMLILCSLVLILAARIDIPAKADQEASGLYPWVSGALPLTWKGAITVFPSWEDHPAAIFFDEAATDSLIDASRSLPLELLAD